jgi:hypothetical protein
MSALAPLLLKNIAIDQTASTKPLQIPVHDMMALEIPALKFMVHYMKNLMPDNRDWDVLPPSKSVECHVILLGATELFHCHKGTKNSRMRIDRALDAAPLALDYVRLLWYAFGDSDDNVDDIALNIVKNGFDDAGLIELFLVSELSHKQKVAFSERLKYRQKRCIMIEKNMSGVDDKNDL